MLLISLKVGVRKAAESELRNTQAELENLRLRCAHLKRLEGAVSTHTQVSLTFILPFKNSQAPSLLHFVKFDSFFFFLK